MDGVAASETLRGGEGTAAPLPPPAPLDMPVQSLRVDPGRRVRRLPTAPRGIAWRRLYIIGGTIALAAGGAREMYLALSVAGLTAIELLVLMLFVALFAWIAFSFVSAAAGFVSLLFRGGLGLGIDRNTPLPTLTTRTALLLPVYNEDPARILGGLQAIYESLAAANALEHFHFFILSDTTDPDTWVAEEAAFLALRDRTGGHDRIFYRRRRYNTERKAGNIADWVTSFGGAYEQLLILDADSVMSADTIVRLAGAMERNPGVGLIQTLPLVVNGTTLFARLQQFAGRLYGPLIAHGIAWWHGAEGNYWGHNAIIRTRAFAEESGLPALRGRKPFGGHIMSHDFVEAALLRRGGWAIHMVPGLRGSYEESPPSLTDLLIRDRRWCQGNLQHIAVLPARGLHWVSRLHLLTGIGSYVTAPMWLLFLLMGVLIALQARFVPPEYFSAERSLFPQWPAQDPVRSMWVFVGTMGVLLLPKLLSLIALIADRETRRGCGGGLRALISVLAETLIAGLLAPVAMLIQSAAVVSILIGRDSGWKPQRRDDGHIPFGAVARRYWAHTLFGLALGVSSWLVAPTLLFWMLPIVLGMVLAVPLAVLTGSPAIGRAFARAGLLLIPEERGAPDVLARARVCARELEHSLRPMEAVERLAADARLREAHRLMLPAPRRPRIDPIDATLLVGLAKIEEADRLEDALSSLTKAEKAAALADAAGVDRLLRLADRRRS